MDNLEPITREETLLDGGDLTPITRKEMFIKRIYDKNQSIPEPITREEYFLKKAGEGSGDVTIEQLNVTENGTYSESGKAYSPVIVDVPAPPIPENAYLLNNLSGLPADIASFSDGTDLPMASLKVTVTPYQDLSHGDPSPENICPIIGWDEAVVTVADDVESPTTSHEYIIDLDGTRYGGVLDATSGELVVDRAMLRLNTANMDNNDNYPGWRNLAELPGIVGANVNNPVSATLNIGGSVVGANTTAVTSGILYLPVNTYKKTQDEWKALAMDIEILLYYATPITVQLAPQPVKSIEGENRIYANCGNIIELEYFSKEV